MAIKYVRQLAHPSNYGGARTSEKIKYIVIHYTGNDGDKAANNAKYFQSPNRNASAHYFVDSENIYQSVSDLYTAWSVGGAKYSDCGKTGGGSLYGKATNANSISIELCDDLKNGKIEPTDNTIQNALILIRELMKKYNIPLDRVIRHFDVNGKKCPSYFVDGKAWQAFKAKIGTTTTNQTTQATNPEPKKEIIGTYQVTAKDGLNVRAGAGTNHKKLYALSKGDKFKVDAFSDWWAHGKDNLNREGWAYLKWLEKVD